MFPMSGKLLKNWHQIMMYWQKQLAVYFHAQVFAPFCYCHHYFPRNTSKQDWLTDSLNWLISSLFYRNIRFNVFDILSWWIIVAKLIARDFAAIYIQNKNKSLVLHTLERWQNLLHRFTKLQLFSSKFLSIISMSSK